MADIQLRVSPDELKNKAGEITKQIQQMERNWNQLCELVNASKVYWEGDAGEHHRKLVKENEKDVQLILKRLKEHPEDLLEMAGIYISAEEQASEIANRLPDNVIV